MACRYRFEFIAVVRLVFVELKVLTVYGVFLADLVQGVAIAATGWRFAVSGWGRQEYLDYPGWPLIVVPGVSSLGEFVLHTSRRELNLDPQLLHGYRCSTPGERS